MSGTDVLWSTPGAQALAWALVQFLWQGTAVALVLAGALAVLRGRSASLRYALAAGALLAMLAWPAVTVLSSLGDGAPVLRAAAPVRFAGEAVPEALRAVLPAESPETDLRALVQPLLPALLAFWIAGVVVLSLYHLGGWLAVRRLVRRGTRPAAERWVALLADLRQRLGIGRAVGLLESTAVAVPSVVGWLRPVVLVPASVLSGLTPEQVEAVLAHELAHVRRHDYLVNLLQAVVETLFFYHPAVWWVSRQMRLEREDCCDDLALAVCGDRLRYARALATLEELRLPAPHLAMAANCGSLLHRIRRIVGAPAGARPKAGLAVAVVLALLLSGAAVQSVRVASARAAEPAAEHQDKDAPLPPRGSKATGGWTAERTKDGLDLQIRVRNSKGNMNSSLEIREGELVGLGAGPDVRFELRRAAGTFRFEGKFDGSGLGAQGAGLFTFVPNPSFAPEMAALGYRVDNDDLLELGIFDVSPAFVRELQGVGYDNLPLERLLEFRIHGVTPDFVRAIVGLGFRDLSPDRLVEYRIHGVTPDFVAKIVEAGYRDLPAERLVEFRIHGVTPEFLAELAGAGYRDVEPEELVAMRIHGVNADFIHEMERQGHKNLSVDELLELRIMGPGRGQDHGDD